MVLRKSEFLKRFREREGLYETSELYLSKDYVIGIPRYENNQERFYSFGVIRLKDNWSKTQWCALQLTKHFFVNTSVLFRTMEILGRRKIVEIGMFTMDRGTVPAVRDGENIVLIAPLIIRSNTSYKILTLEEFCEGYDKERIEEWEKWARILGKEEPHVEE
jgi:hypothetical protein